MPQIAFSVALAAATICTPLAAGARALWGRLLDPAGDLLQKGKLATTMPPGLSRIVASVRQIIRTNVSAHSLIQVRALSEYYPPLERQTSCQITVECECACGLFTFLANHLLIRS